MTLPTIEPIEVFKTLVQRVPDLAGLLIALVLLFSIYQAQEQRLYDLQERYYAIVQTCALSAR